MFTHIQLHPLKLSESTEMEQHILLTPGPITTTKTVKEAMLTDWGSWDGDFKELTAFIRKEILAIAHAEETHVCIPMQGSGTFSVEATLTTLVPKDGKLLILMNGAYGQRMAKTFDYLGREYVTIDKGDYLPPQPDEVEEALINDPAITHVAVVHCETSSGILNPVGAISEVVYKQGRELIIDAMSSFGALSLDARELKFAAIVSSANKCLEGVPGFGFCILRKDLVEKSAGNSHSLSLDLIDQFKYMEKSGQWRYTPPTHVVAALVQAIKEYNAEGGREARLAKYKANFEVLVPGMKSLGIYPLIENPDWLSPIIVTFLSPEHPNFNFQQFYDKLKERGFIIYPGKLTIAESFRIGCIGAQCSTDYKRLIDSVKEALDELGVQLELA